MIKATELRIGNFILDVQDKKPCNVTIEILQEIYGEMNFYEPIPLTEEWLLKFGFEKVVYNSDEEGYGTDYHLECSNGVFICYADDFSLGLYTSEYDMINGLVVIPNWEMTKHVHQLQNLYFALTGEELVLK